MEEIHGRNNNAENNISIVLLKCEVVRAIFSELK
jgi:hypothetical protein